MKLLLFGGTTEGRRLAAALSEQGHEVTVSCATPLGIEELKGIPCRTLCGRRDAAEIAELAHGFDLVIDATHPYAVLVSENIRLACSESGKERIRVLREPGAHPDCASFRTCREAAEALKSTEGRVLLAIGSKELSAFAGLPPERLVARILPTHAGLEACERLGIPHRNILALQGPFSKELNEALMRQHDIRLLVTKNSGREGGFSEKLAAAEAVGAKVLLIEPPEDAGISAEELVERMKGKCT